MGQFSKVSLAIDNGDTVLQRALDIEKNSQNQHVVQMSEGNSIFSKGAKTKLI